MLYYGKKGALLREELPSSRNRQIRFISISRSARWSYTESIGWVGTHLKLQRTSLLQVLEIDIRLVVWLSVPTNRLDIDILSTVVVGNDA